MADTSSTHIAQQFAQSLIEGEYEAAKKLLAGNCSYDTSRGIIQGLSAIVNAYQHGISGKSLPDNWKLESPHIEKGDETSSTLHFSYTLSHKEKGHNYRFKQVLTVNQKGEIVKIRQYELPGELKKLEDFYREVGLG